MNRVIQALSVAALLIGCETFLDFRSRGHGTGGAGGSAVCEPGTSMPCYPGPVGTEDIGVCRAGAAACLPDGTYGPCEGATIPSAEDCTTPADEDCDGFAPSCGSDLHWARRFGDSQIQLGTRVAIDAEGNVIVAGSIVGGSIDFGGGPLTGPASLFVAKLDREGGHLWSKRLDGLSEGFDLAITTDPSDAIILAGRFAGSINFGSGAVTSAGLGDIFVAKLDPDGNVLFARFFGDAADQGAEALATDPAGHIYVTGSFEGTLDFGGGSLTSVASADLFVLKLDAAGNHVLSRRFGATADQRGTGLAVAPGGDIIVTGTFGGSMDLDGTPLLASSPEDVFIVRLGPSMEHRWSAVAGEHALDTQPCEPRIAVDPLGRTVLLTAVEALKLGSPELASAGGGDIFLTQLGTGGEVLWRHRFGDADDQFPTGLAVDSSGRITVTGAFGSTLDLADGPLEAVGGLDIFIGRLDPNGSGLWSKRFGDGEAQVATAVAIGSMGETVLTGFITGVVDFGNGPLFVDGQSDVFVARFLGP